MFFYIETRKMKEKTIEDLKSLVKKKEGNNSSHQSNVVNILHNILVINFLLIYIKLLRRIYCQCLMRDRKS